MPDLITEDWLRSTGFKWEQGERQPYKHWFLWIGRAIPDVSDGWSGADELAIEVSKGNAEGTWWYFWLRSDLGGRYSQFIHVRHLSTIGQLTRFIEAVTDRPWDPANVLYGQLWTPKAAARHRREEERLDWRIARDQAAREGKDDTKV